MDKAFGLKGTINPLKIITHPIDTIESLKEKKNGSVISASIILLLYTIAEIMLTVGKGFIFNTSRVQDFNIVMVLARSLFLILLFVIANWALCTLLDGEGRVIDIYIITCYSLIPLVADKIMQLITSNILTDSEYVFVTMVSFCLMLWFGCLILFGLKTIHNYTLTKTVLNAAATIVGMVIIFFILFLFIVLVQQLYIFFATIYTELVMR